MTTLPRAAHDELMIERTRDFQHEHMALGDSYHRVPAEWGDEEYIDIQQGNNQKGQRRTMVTWTTNEQPEVIEAAMTEAGFHLPRILPLKSHEGNHLLSYGIPFDECTYQWVALVENERAIASMGFIHDRGDRPTVPVEVIAQTGTPLVRELAGHAIRTSRLVRLG